MSAGTIDEQRAKFRELQRQAQMQFKGLWPEVNEPLWLMYKDGDVPRIEPCQDAFFFLKEKDRLNHGDYSVLAHDIIHPCAQVTTTFLWLDFNYLRKLGPHPQIFETEVLDNKIIRIIRTSSYEDAIKAHQEQCVELLHA